MSLSPRERLEALACYLWGVDKVDVSTREADGRVFAVIESLSADGLYLGKNANDATADKAIDRLAQLLLDCAQRELDRAERELVKMEEAADRFRREVRWRTIQINNIDPALLEGMQGVLSTPGSEP